MADESASVMLRQESEAHCRSNEILTTKPRLRLATGITWTWTKPSQLIFSSRLLQSQLSFLMDPPSSHEAETRISCNVATSLGQCADNLRCLIQRYKRPLLIYFGVFSQFNHRDWWQRVWHMHHHAINPVWKSISQMKYASLLQLKRRMKVTTFDNIIVMTVMWYTMKDK